jgi:hypothetical protein
MSEHPGRPQAIAFVCMLALATAIVAVTSCFNRNTVHTDPAVRTQAFPKEDFEEKVFDNAKEMIEDGKRIFRYDTFGSEAYWGGKLQLHKVLARKEKGGLGDGLTPKKALQLGLKADVGKVPRLLLQVLREGAVSLDDPDTTLELLRAEAVVGVKGVFDDKNNLKSVGITCALCHSTVDDSFMRGIGRRLDGWPNRDIDVGAIVALAPNLRAMAEEVHLTEADLKKVLTSWGPGKYDAELNQDGKAYRPDGGSAATVMPAAFGLAGQNLHTYAGWGSIPYWNAYVANTQMRGQGVFYDPRLADAQRYPLGSALGFADKRDEHDHITSKLAALHFYQIAIPAPRPPTDSYDHRAAERGKIVFDGPGQCARCHVPPLFSEPGWPMHDAKDIGIDDFQANRAPDRKYRTTPLSGLFTRAKGGFYHDGRFAKLTDVVAHYEGVLHLELTQQQRNDLVEYLKSL